MAEETIKSAFTEVLEIRTDVPLFEQELNKLSQAYNEWVAGLDSNAKDVLGAGAVSAFNKEISESFKNVEALTQSSFEGINRLTEVMVEFAEKTDAVLDSIAGKEVERTKKTEKAKQEELRKTALLKEDLKGRTTLLPTTPDFEIEQEGLVNKANLEQIKLLGKAVQEMDAFVERSASKRLGVLNEELNKAEGLYRQEQAELALKQKQGELEESLASKRQSIYKDDLAAAEEMFKAEQKATTQKEKEAALVEALAQKKRSILNAELAAAEELYKSDVRATEQAQRADNAKEKSRRDIAIGNEGTENLAMEQYNKAVERAIAATNRLNLARLDSLTAKVAELKAQLAEVNDEIEEFARQGATIDRDKGQSVEAEVQQKYAVALEKSATLTEKLRTATRQLNDELRRTGQEASNAAVKTAEVGGAGSKAFDALASSFTKLAGSFGSLIKFYVLWNTITGVVNVLTETIKAPFKVIAEGVKYMQNLETQTSELVSVLTANVEFSASMAQNFEKARIAAKQITELLEERSIMTGVPAEQLESTFRALVSGGAAKGVQTMRQLVQLAEVFQLTLKAAGVGALAAQGSIEEITRIFLGTGENFNKFVNGLRLTREEWTKIRDEGLKHGDLLDRLSDRMRPYMDAVQKTQFDQAKLIANVELLGKRLSALGGAELYEGLSNALQQINRWLIDNKEKAAAFVKVFADGVLLAIKGLTFLLSNNKQWDVLMERMLLIRDTMLKTAVAMGTVFKNGLIPVTPTQFKEALLGFVEMKSAFKEIDKSSDNIRKLFSGETKLPKELENLLDSAFNTKEKKPIVDSQLGVIQSEFTKQRQAYLNDVEDVQEANKRLRNSYEEQAAAGKLSAEQALVLIRRNIEGEISALTALDKAFDDTIARTRKKILTQSGGTKPEQQQAALNQLDGQVEGIERSSKKRIQSLQDGLSTAVKRAAHERVQLTKSELNSELQLTEIASEQQKQLYEDAKQSHYLTDVEYFDAVTLLEEKTYEAKRARYEKDLSDYVDGTKPRQEIQENIDKLDAEHTKNQTVRSAQRATLLEKERLKLQQFQDQMRAVDLAAADAEEKLFRALNPNAGFTGVMDKLLDLRGRELDILSRQTEENLKLARAKNVESDQTKQLTQELKSLQNARSELYQTQVQSIIGGTRNGTVRSVLLNDAATQENRRLSSQMVDARTRLSEFDAANPTIGDDPKLRAVRESLVKELSLTEQAWKRFRESIDRDIIPSTKTAIKGFFSELIGPSTVQAWNKASGAISKLAVGAEGAANVLGNIQGLINAYQQGHDQGGVLGGTGSVIQSLSTSKKVTDLFSKIPVIGQFIPAIGGILSFVGSMFTAAAKRIAEDVKKSFQKTIDNYSAGNATLIETLNALERQRSDAVVRLSGKKGGKDELDKLLPEFDREISSLRKQQQQIVEGFDQSLAALRLHSDTLSTVNKQWQDINKQVKDYLGAGGDAAKAAEFLQLSLEKIRKDAADQLDQAEQDAIQNAIKLNDLLEQRIKLVDDFKQKEFDLINADALERRQSGSVTRGKELAQLRKEHQEQLENIDSQIKMTQARVDKEREIFNLATDTAALRRRDEELALRALEEQINKLRDLKSIVAGIGLVPTAFGPSNVTYDITINIDGSGEQSGRDAADGFLDELTRRTRYAPAF